MIANDYTRMPGAAAAAHEVGARAVEQMANEVAHDIRNVLNNLSLGVQQLELTLDAGDEPCRRVIERLRRQLVRLRQLAEELPARAARSIEP